MKILIINQYLMTELSPLTSNSEQGPSSNQQSHELHNGPLVMLFLIFGVLAGTFLREVNKRYKFPYTPMLLVFGIILGYFKQSFGMIGASTTIIQKLNPHMILLIFIPTLIFESAFNCQWHVVRKCMVNILMLAAPGVLWGAIILAACFKWLLFYTDDELNWYQALTLGCVLSATDPVAVVALLKELGASVRFNTLVEGESLLNDGTAMVFFALFLDLAKGNSASVSSVLFNFVRTSIGGPLLGIIFGFLICLWIKRIIRDNVLSVTVTVVGAYLCFWVAEFTFLKVSGILSIVTLGLYMAALGKRKIYPQSQHAMHDVWSFIQYNCQTLIFIITGAVVGTQMIRQSTITGWDWIKMLIFWFLMIVARAIMVLSCYPVLKKTGYGITKKQIVVLVYGGLRGALGMCLSLIVGVDPTLPQRFRQLTVFYMCGMAMLTIIVNGLTCGKLVAYVQMISQPEIKRKLLKRCIKDVLSSTQQKLKELKNQPNVAYAQWRDVERLADVRKLGQTIHERVSGVEPRDSMRQLKKSEMVDEIRFRFTRYLMKIYWDMFEHGQISENSIALLSQNCEVVNDETGVKLRYFQLLSSNFTMNTVKYYLKVKNWPILGPTFTKMIINKVYDAYQISTAFIQASQQAIHVFQRSFPMSSQHLHYVIDQVKDNVEQAVLYVTELENNYQTVIKAVHTAKATTTLLKHKKHKLEQMYEEGFVDGTDYSTLRKQIDQSIIRVQLQDFQLTDIKFNEVLTDCPLFSSLPTHEIVSIRMKSNQRLFTKGTTIQSKDKQIKNVYFIITGSVKQQFDNFSFTKGIGSVINPHDFFYQENSKANVKTMTDTKVMQIQGKAIHQLLEKYPEFKKRWLKSVFPYSIKFTQASEFIQKQFNSRQQRRFIEGSIVVFLTAGQLLNIDFGAYVFEGQVYSDGGTYIRGQFISQNKTIKAETNAKIMQFQNVAGIKFETQRISAVNRDIQD